MADTNPMTEPTDPAALPDETIDLAEIKRRVLYAVENGANRDDIGPLSRDVFRVFDRAAAVRHLIARALTAARRLETARADAETLRDVLIGIKTHGELACVSVGPSWSYSGGKKPESKEVWQFPRHMLTDIDAALAALQPQDAPAAKDTEPHG